MAVVLEYFLFIRDIASRHPLFSIGILLVIGYYFGKLAGKLGLPAITGFIVAGLVMGNAVLGIVPPHMNRSLKLITELALGFIALTIGGEFSVFKLRRMGRSVLIITGIQILLAFTAVSVSMMLLDVEWPFALLLGGVSRGSAAMK